MANVIASVSFSVVNSLYGMGLGPAPDLWIMLPELTNQSHQLGDSRLNLLDMLTPESLVSKERHYDRRTAFGQTYGSSSCTSVMDYSRYAFFVEKPIVWDISWHINMRWGRSSA